MNYFTVYLISGTAANIFSNPVPFDFADIRHLDAPSLFAPPDLPVHRRSAAYVRAQSAVGLPGRAPAHRDPGPSRWVEFKILTFCSFILLSILFCSLILLSILRWKFVEYLLFDGCIGKRERVTLVHNISTLCYDLSVKHELFITSSPRHLF